MKRLKSIIGIIVLGFLAFAPPGTLIGLVLLLTAITGNIWIVIGGAAFLALIGLIWFIQKRVRTRSGSDVIKD